MKKKRREEEEKRKIFSLLTNLVMLTLIIFSLNGCIAALPLLMAANAGIVAHTVVKTVQISTDGDVEMAIGENEVVGKKKLVLSEISRLAIWPDEGMVCVADELQKSKVFDFIATPSKTGKILNNTHFSKNIANLTYSEKMEAFQKVCEGTQTEAIVIFENLGTTSNMRMWSFSRSSLNFKGKILIYELQSNQIIFSSITEMSIGLGGSTPNQQEIMVKASKMLANRLIELKHGQTVAQK